jgi:hypothetical protein
LNPRKQEGRSNDPTHNPEIRHRGLVDPGFWRRRSAASSVAHDTGGKSGPVPLKETHAQLWAAELRSWFLIITWFLIAFPSRFTGSLPFLEIPGLVE